jgi:propionate CoA-transferase
VTERAVFRLVDDGIELVEIAPGLDLETDVLAAMEFKPRISDHLTVMDERIFQAEPLGLDLAAGRGDVA